MKKNILLALLLILTLFSLIACRIKPIEKIEEESSEQEIVLDLSEYDIVGEWSDGKAMVHKTESSYDYVEGSFANPQHYRSFRTDRQGRQRKRRDPEVRRARSAGV